MRRDPREARLLGLWTAACLAVLLLAGILWIGDLSLQWPVLVVPLVWALVAARPRRSAAYEDVHDGESFPATREAPTLPSVPRERTRRDW